MRTIAPPLRAAYTLVEILIVVLVLMIAAAIVIPNIGSADYSQATSAAAVLQSDLEVARSLAMTTQQPYSVVFSLDRLSYKVVANYAGVAYAAAVAVNHPVIKGKPYEVHLNMLNGAAGVSVTSVAFGVPPQQYVTFQSLGAPVAGGSVVLRAGNYVVTVSVEGLTGIVSVTRAGG